MGTEGKRIRTLPVPAMEHRVSTESSIPVENTKLALAGAAFLLRTNLYR
jgi:hypothetical protein